MRRVAFIAVLLFFAAASAFAQPAAAEGGPAVAAAARSTIIGGKQAGWTIDFSQVTRSQKWQMGWSDDKLVSTGFKPYDQFYDAPGVAAWRVAGKGVVVHLANGPSFFSVIEMLGDTAIVDIKKLHYRAMSTDRGVPQGFEMENERCVELQPGAQSCAIPLRFGPSKTFYAVFYSWNVGERRFVLAVRNAQPVPDRARPEEGAKILISLIRIGGAVE